MNWSRKVRKLLVWVLLLAVTPTWAAPNDSLDRIPRVVEDTARKQLREPDKDLQEDAFSNDDYNYVREEKAANEETIFDRMFRNIVEGFGRSVVQKEQRNWWVILFIILAVLLILLIAMRATNTGFNSLFTGKSRSQENIDATAEDVDIHTIDYEYQIAEAARLGDYRLGVRLWFLRTLKQLADADHVHWKVDKTNSDYVRELGSTNFVFGFREVSLIYDYIWYGDFPVDGDVYKKAEDRFQTFYKSIK
jgi:uncharacterized integral membrane protein